MPLHVCACARARERTWACMRSLICLFNNRLTQVEEKDDAPPRVVEMKPTKPNTQLNPSVSGPLLRQLRALRMTVGPRAIQSKNAATS